MTTIIPAMMHSARNESTKTCACTGVRWCASCRDPRVRERYRMNDPVSVPSFLSSRPAHSLSRSDSLHGIHHFDLETQVAPSCPEFRGVHVIREFLSRQEAEQLLREIDEVPFRPAQSGKLKQHYGPKVNFNKQKINSAQFRGLPNYARQLESRTRRLVEQVPADRTPDPVALRLAVEAFETTDVFVLRYLEQAESNLDFHRDDTFAYGEVILDVSLESDSVLTFLERPKSESESHRLRCVRVPLPARSVLVLYGQARSDWDHAILAYDVAGRRTSVTLRTLSENLRHSDSGRRILEIVRGGPAAT